MLPDVHQVELDNGFRAMLVVRRNLPVVACFEDVTPQITLVKFRRAGEE